jgi:hypothetical protein
LAIAAVFRAPARILTLIACSITTGWRVTTVDFAVGTVLIPLTKAVTAAIPRRTICTCLVFFYGMTNSIILPASFGCATTWTADAIARTGVAVFTHLAYLVPTGAVQIYAITIRTATAVRFLIAARSPDVGALSIVAAVGGASLAIITVVISGAFGIDGV